MAGPAGIDRRGRLVSLLRGFSKTPAAFWWSALQKGRGARGARAPATEGKSITQIQLSGEGGEGQQQAADQCASFRDFCGRNMGRVWAIYGCGLGLRIRAVPKSWYRSIRRRNIQLYIYEVLCLTEKTTVFQYNRNNKTYSLLKWVTKVQFISWFSSFSYIFSLIASSFDNILDRIKCSDF